VFETLDRPSRVPVSTIVGALGVVLAVGGGAAVALAPLPAVGLTGGLLGLVGLLAIGQRSGRVFLVGLAAVLLIYAFLNRGGAYIGIAPLYIGEGILFVGVMALALNFTKLRFGPIHWLLVAFMAWGAYRTIPYIGTYGLDALRDAVTWAYGLFAIVIVATIRPRDFATLVSWYRKILPFFVVAMPIVAVVTQVFGDAIPKWPNTPSGGVGIIYFGNGHTGVHLAGVGAFILLGFYGLRRRERALEPLIWVVWLVGVAICGSLNRGALLAASTCGLAVAFLRDRSRWLSLAIVAPLLLALVAAINPVIDLGTTRKVSFDQLIDNVLSIVGSSSNSDLEGTAEWRLAWWQKIADYTINGPYFWDGKGYGINLADDDGFQVGADDSLRAPHNGHIEILARSGVPGLVLWILLQGAYALGLIRAAIRANRAGRGFWVRIHAWLLIYWLAAMIDLSFDPYLEGPHGGIWFWALFGLGLAAMRAAETDEGAEVDATALRHPEEEDPRPARPGRRPLPQPTPV
jgi:hypothetical protein